MKINHEQSIISLVAVVAIIAIIILVSMISKPATPFSAQAYSTTTKTTLSQALPPPPIDRTTALTPEQKSKMGTPDGQFALTDTYAWTECVNKYQKSCDQICDERGQACGERCTTANGDPSWGAEAWYNPEGCSWGQDNAGQKRCGDVDTAPYPQPRWKCCCSGTPPPGDCTTVGQSFFDQYPTGLHLSTGCYQLDPQLTQPITYGNTIWLTGDVELRGNNKQITFTNAQSAAITTEDDSQNHVQIKDLTISITGIDGFLLHGYTSLYHVTVLCTQQIGSAFILTQNSQVDTGVADGCLYGFYMYHEGTQVQYSTARHSKNAGFYVMGGSAGEGSVAEDNTCTGDDCGYGFYIRDASFNLGVNANYARRNRIGVSMLNSQTTGGGSITATSNTLYGIYLKDSQMIQHSTVTSDSNSIGYYLEGNSELRKASATSNTDYGIFLKDREFTYAPKARQITANNNNKGIYVGTASQLLEGNRACDNSQYDISCKLGTVSGTFTTSTVQNQGGCTVQVQYNSCHPISPPASSPLFVKGGSPIFNKPDLEAYDSERTR